MGLKRTPIVPDAPGGGAYRFPTRPGFAGFKDRRDSGIQPTLGGDVLFRSLNKSPGFGLPSLAIPEPPRFKPTRRTTTPVPAAVIRPDIVSVKKVTPRVAPDTKQPLLKKEPTVGLDLGKLIGDLGGRFIDAKWGGGGAVSRPGPPGGVVNWGGAGYGTPSGGGVQYGGPTFISDDSGPGFGIPGYEVISESELDKGMVYKKVCGQYKWVKQKRRRRKTLMTESDYNALLRIQSLKVNQNMTIALAKTLGR